MSLLDKKYVLTINLEDSAITYPLNMFFFNTDKNIANLYVKVQYRDEVIKYISKEDAVNYNIKLTAIKPKTNTIREIEGIITNEFSEDYAIYKFELPSEFTDQVGSVACEFVITNSNEIHTIKPFSYTINASKVTGLNPEIVLNPDLPILKQLIKDVKSAQQWITNIDDVNVSEVKTYSSKKINEQFISIKSEKLDKNGIVTMANMGQDVKEALVGGNQNIAVVGENAVLNETIVDGIISYNKFNKQLQQAFDEQIEVVPFESFNGYWKYTGALDVTPNVVLDTGIEGTKYIEVNVLPGEKYYLSGKSYYNVKMFILVDAKGNHLNMLPIDSIVKTHADEPIVIPNKVVKMYVCSKDVLPIVKKVTSYTPIQNLPSVITENIKYVYVSKDANMNNGFYKYYGDDALTIQLSGNISYKHIDKINVKEGEKYLISGTSYQNVKLYIYASNGVVKSYYPQDNSKIEHNEVEITIPNGVNELYISSFEKDIVIKKLEQKFVTDMPLNIETIKNLLNPIYNKSIAWFGDSITDVNNKTWAYHIPINNGMISNSYAVSGSVISYIPLSYQQETTYTNCITKAIETYIEQIKNCDYIIFSGGFNDGARGYAYKDGELTALNDFTGNLDLYTFYGALEKCCRLLLSKCLGKKIGFIITPNNPENTGFRDYKYPAIIKTLNKYSIPYIDLFKEGGLCAGIPEVNNGGFYKDDDKDGIGDKTHPSELGYTSYLINKVESWIKTL